MALKNNVFYQWFMDTFNSVSILNWVLINDTPGIGHLWYLYAMLYSFIAIYVIDKLKIKVKCRILPSYYCDNTSFAKIRIL